MAAQLFLIAPADADAARFPSILQGVLAAAPVSALLLPRGMQSEAGYAALVKLLLPVGQAAGAAVLIEGEPAQARTLGADGLHVQGLPGVVKSAIAALQPAMIVGTGGIKSRHDAMILGELGADYLMFGPLSGPSDDEAREMAQWWAETMQIPGVFSNPGATPDTADSANCEFLGLSDSIWKAGGAGAAMLAAVAARLGAS